MKEYIEVEIPKRVGKLIDEGIIKKITIKNDYRIVKIIVKEGNIETKQEVTIE